MTSTFRKLNNRRGFTMAEMLITVAIIGILSAVAFISVMSYQRSMAQLERDGIAKQLFVAAQNNLTYAKGEGYLGKNTYGTLEEGSTDVYYYAVNAGVITGGGDDAFALMLPFGAIDETVRAGGSYLIRYQQSTGLVLDVFYSTISGSPEKYNHSLSVGEYSNLMQITGTENKSARKNYTDDSVIGWYGGTEAQSLAKITLAEPTVEVKNAEILSVTVTNPNPVTNSTVRLIVTGQSSGVSHYFTITESERTIVLDDITTAEGHFAELRFDDMTIETGNGFIPGENITIQAVAFSVSDLANIAYSALQTTNSLFADATDTNGDDTLDTVSVSNIRHLENLDKAISGLGENDPLSGSRVAIDTALQTDNLSWTDFTDAIGGESVSIYKYNNETAAVTDSYYPVNLEEALEYDGQNHSISDITVDYDGNAGLFAETASGSTIANLELIDFTVTGTANAGALAGVLNNTDVTNVLARNTTGSTDADITAAADNAGGLIGSMNGGSVQYSAAALTVSGGSTAGGLIGEISGTASVADCYAGGHTDLGEYYTHDEDGNRIEAIYNVTASSGTAGGLIGSAGDSTISDSYATTSVSGSTAGGLAGSASGSITNSYCTGLVSGTEDNAFLGSGSPSVSGCYYDSAVNEVITTDSSGTVTAILYKEPGVSGVTAMDADAAAYNKFYTGEDRDPAVAYDTELVKVYNGEYNLQTVYGLAGITTPDDSYFVSTHYGDWPEPEAILINSPAG